LLKALKILQNSAINSLLYSPSVIMLYENKKQTRLPADLFMKKNAGAMQIIS
jgi:hypothetical protein